MALRSQSAPADYPMSAARECEEHVMIVKTGLTSLGSHRSDSLINIVLLNPPSKWKMAIMGL